MVLNQYQLSVTVLEKFFMFTVKEGTFHSTKNSGLHFWKFPVGNGTTFFGLNNFIHDHEVVTLSKVN